MAVQFVNQFDNYLIQRLDLSREIAENVEDYLVPKDSCRRRSDDRESKGLYKIGRVRSHILLRRLNLDLWLCLRF